MPSSLSSLQRSCRYLSPNTPDQLNHHPSTSQLHHGKHHATYVTNLNLAEEKLSAAVGQGDVSAVIGLQGALRFNGGGHLNHSIFWKNLCPGGSGEPSGVLADLINRDFGSLTAMQERLSASTVAVQVMI